MQIPKLSRLSCIHAILKCMIIAINLIKSSVNSEVSILGPEFPEIFKGSNWGCLVVEDREPLAQWKYLGVCE